MAKKKTKPLLTYIGFFFVFIGIITVFFVNGLTEIILLPLCLLIGAVCLIIGFTIRDFQKMSS